MTYLRLITTALITTAALAALVSTASAGRLEESSSTKRATYSRMDFTGGFGTSECEVTLEGSLHSRTYTKTVGILLGYITNARVATRCRRGSATLLQESLPWHVRYEAFAGTLPNITKVITTITGIRYGIREPLFGITCLAEGGTFSTTFSTAAGSLDKAILGGESPTNCGATGTLSGTSTTLTRLNETGRIVLRLI